MHIRNMFRTAGFAFLSASLTLIFACGQKKEPVGLVRFIDVLRQDNILQSPFQSLAENPDFFKEKHPYLHAAAEREFLQDEGTGENPLLLKKKMKIGPVEINALLAPPSSRFRFAVPIPSRGVFEVTYGIRRDRGLEEGRAKKRTVQFSAVLRVGETRDILLNKTLTLTREKTLEFNYKKVDLSQYEGQTVEISLITQGNKDALACWFNPVIYRPKEAPQNVILISLDTLRPDHLGCYGYGRDTSPNMDKLAKDSALFVNTFASSPWTLPSHVSLLTSLNCINHQVYRPDDKMDPAMTTLADMIRSKDYFLSAITGGGYVSGIYGFSKGFDSYHVAGGEINKPDSAEIAARDVLSYIDQHKDRDFFLFVHTYQIHHPYFSPPEYAGYFSGEEAAVIRVNLNDMELYRKNRFMPISEKGRQNLIDLYDAEIRYTDDVLIRPIVEKLKALNLYDNTMIVLISDHGEEFYEHKSWRHTHSVYNETIKVPLIIKFFNSRHAGKRIQSYVRLVDAMPTILDALKIPRSDLYMDGESVIPLLESGEKPAKERIFLSELANEVIGGIPKKVAINQDRDKLIINDPYTEEDLDYLRFPPPEVDPIEIFNLVEDSQELSNRIQADPQLARRLMVFIQEHHVQKMHFKGDKTEVSKEILEQLRALGYIK
jgi:arylsulfatase A-like enzyme